MPAKFVSLPVRFKNDADLDYHLFTPREARINNSFIQLSNLYDPLEPLLTPDGSKSPLYPANVKSLLGYDCECHMHFWWPIFDDRDSGISQAAEQRLRAFWDRRFEVEFSTLSQTYRWVIPLVSVTASERMPSNRNKGWCCNRWFEWKQIEDKCIFWNYN